MGLGEGVLGAEAGVGVGPDSEARRDVGAGTTAATESLFPVVSEEESFAGVNALGTT